MKVETSDNVFTVLQVAHITNDVNTVPYNKPFVIYNMTGTPVWLTCTPFGDKESQNLLFEPGWNPILLRGVDSLPDNVVAGY